MHIDHSSVRWRRENDFFLSFSANPSSMAQVAHSAHVPHGFISGNLCPWHISGNLNPRHNSGNLCLLHIWCQQRWCVWGFLTVHLDFGFVHNHTLFKPLRPFSIYEHHIFLWSSHFFLCVCSDVTPLNPLNTFLFLYLCRSPHPQILAPAHLQTLFHV